MGCLSLLLAPNLAWLVVLGLPWPVGGALVYPSLSALVSRRAGAGQGEALGQLGAFDHLGRVSGPLWSGAVYGHGLAYPFVVGAALATLALALAATRLGVETAKPKRVE